MIDLEAKLKENQPLFEIYSRIRGKAEHIWKEPLLHDFTEHGPRHSGKIIAILNDILGHWEKFNLNDSEILVLLASAWLHDIGMQNMKDAEGKADILRETHAEYSYRIILKDGMVDESIFLKKLECGFRDGHGEIQDYNLLNCVALVCKGHSGKHFQEVVDRFQEHPHSVFSRKVDGAFLTALLMAADELDLKERGNMAPNKNYSPMSNLHQKKHQRIYDVDYNFDSNARQIIISVCFQFLENEEEGFRKRLTKWVFDKLAGQFSLTMQIFQRRMGYFISPEIRRDTDFPVLPDAQYPKEFSPDEISLLERETAEMDLYDRKAEKAQLQKLLEPDAPGGIFYYYNVDLYDRDLFFGWFEKAARAHPKIFFHSISLTPESAFTFTQEFLLKITDSFLKNSGSSTKTVIVVENVDILHQKLQGDLLKELSESTALQSTKAVVVLLSSAAEESGLRKMFNHVQFIGMKHFTKEIIREVLESPKIPTGHNLENLAAKLYNSTSGKPEKVYEIVELLKQ
ncbi:MAG: hypothetical protein HZA01_12375 [Nitrospinae bacterium]|nr:hypothetical protein [Nitrospinota bacterium]